MKITSNKNWYRIKSLIPGPLFEPLLNVFYFLQGLRFIGSAHHCPVCENSISKFNSNSCPKCGSGIRHRAMWLFMQRKTNFFKNELSVLHFAPEHCFFKHMQKLKNLKYLSADIGSPRAMVEVDMTNIQYQDNTFDVLISSHVLEHVSDDLKAMKELQRVQKLNGWSIHLAPIDYSRTETYENPEVKTPEEREKVFGHYDHRRIYGTDYKSRLESSGFKVSVFKTSDFCSENEITKMGLKKDTEIYYCTK